MSHPAIVVPKDNPIQRGNDMREYVVNGVRFRLSNSDPALDDKNDGIPKNARYTIPRTPSHPVSRINLRAGVQFQNTLTGPR